jgi:hypothetical protein
MSPEAGVNTDSIKNEGALNVIPCGGLPTGCVVRQQPPSNRTVAVWWADSAERPLWGNECGWDLDWNVTYKTNTPAWIKADPTRYRYYGAGWSRVRTVGKSVAATIDNELPGITLCLSSQLNYNDVRYGSYLWLTP